MCHYSIIDMQWIIQALKQIYKHNELNLSFIVWLPCTCNTSRMITIRHTMDSPIMFMGHQWPLATTALSGSVVQTVNRLSVIGCACSSYIYSIHSSALYHMLALYAYVTWVASKVIRVRQALEQNERIPILADIFCTDEKQVSGLPRNMILSLVDIVCKKNIRYRWRSHHFVPKRIPPEDVAIAVKYIFVWLQHLVRTTSLT